MFKTIKAQNYLNRMTIFISFSVIALLLCISTSSPCQQLLNVTIPFMHLGVQTGERVASFEINISGGQIVSFPDVPRGWGIFIDNNPNQTARMRGNAGVGSAFLEPSFFDKFILIIAERDRESLGIKIRLGTVTNVTLQERLIDLKKKDIELKNVK